MIDKKPYLNSFLGIYLNIYPDPNFRLSVFFFIN